MTKVTLDRGTGRMDQTVLTLQDRQTGQRVHKNLTPTEAEILNNPLLTDKEIELHLEDLRLRESAKPKSPPSK